jgi:phosphoglucomutase/phosphomannomutase
MGGTREARFILPVLSLEKAQVEKRFAALSSNSALVQQAVTSLEEWLSHPVYADSREPIESHLQHDQFALLLDSFYQMVPFGTGGRRGRVGFGPNRINPVTVAMSVQGHCNYLHETGATSGCIVVAFDTRIFADIARTYAFLGDANPLRGLTSRALARLACEIYAANGFEVRVAGVHSDREYLSTPELSFAIRYLAALGGMNVSASHNHPDDNGFKFFNHQGAQDIPPTDQTMASYMGDVKEIRKTGWDTALTQGKIRALPENLHPAYIAANLAVRNKSSLPVNVVYTPLCGTGNGSVGDVLRAAGYLVHVYQPHNNFDGTFAEVPFRMPNPEVPEAASPALAAAKELGADMVLSTDPDADRVGVFAKDAHGRWHYFNGNQIAAVLAYYLCLDAEIGPRRKGVLIKTLVTTRMIQRIAEQAGCAIVSDLLVGFKYIAHVLDCFEREGHYKEIEAATKDLIMAGEESHGILLTAAVRDKDAAGGALILCELLAQLRAHGRYLPEYRDAMTKQCGSFQNAARSIVMKGIRGVALLQQMMDSLRAQPPKEFAGMPVRRALDLLQPEHGPLRSDTERLSRNFLVYELDRAQVVVRPSGTEPKAKIYVDLEGATPAEARALAAQISVDCIGRLGVTLSTSASLLPDYVDLDLRVAFDTKFRLELEAALPDFASNEQPQQLHWLRERLAPYGSGSDPLAAASQAVSHLLGELGHPDLAHSVAAVSTPVDWVM